MLLPVLAFAISAVVAWLIASSAVKLAWGLASAALVLVTMPVRTGVRCYGRGLRHARVHP